MHPRRVLLACLFVLLLGVALAQPPDPLAANNGVQPLEKGPIHEAFAQPYEVETRPSPIVPKQPPDPIEEVPPDERPAGNNVVWIPGYWAWDDERADFIWVSGFWRDVPPHRVWVPGYWAPAEGGWQWVAGYWADDRQTEQELLPPPPPSLDEGPSSPAPSDRAVYVPGIWIFRAGRYAWRPGFWVNQQPGWIYTPARYFWTPAGYAFNDGYWDYALQDRGLLFAPAAINAGLWNQPNWAYTPSYAINPVSLLSSLFARPLMSHYYYGNYYSPSYYQAGYVPWLEQGGRQNYASPLVGYYRWRNSGNWLNQQRQHYTTLRQAAPTTARQQQTTVVAPVTQLKQHVTLQKVNPATLASERQAATALRAAAIKRREQEVHAAKAQPKVETPRRLPHVAAPARPAPAVSRKVEVPAHPTVPQHVVRQVPAARPAQAPHRFEATPRAAAVPHVEPKAAPHVNPAPRTTQPHPAAAPHVEQKAAPHVEQKAAPHVNPVPRTQPHPAAAPHVEQKAAPHVEQKTPPHAAPAPHPAATPPRPAPRREPERKD
jgi:hypothetical protein